MGLPRYIVIGFGTTTSVAWLTSLAFNAGILVWHYAPYQDEVYNIELLDELPDPPPTYGPMGRRCIYLTYSGTRDVFFVDEGDEIASAVEVAPWVRRATIVSVAREPEECPFLYRFGSAR